MSGKNKVIGQQAGDLSLCHFRVPLYGIPLRGKSGNPGGMDSPVKPGNDRIPWLSDRLQNKCFFFRRFFAIIIYLYAALFLSRFCLAAEPEQRKIFVYDAQDKKDPFLPLVSSDGRILEPQIVKGSEGRPQIEGIIYEAGGSSYAVVNGEVIKAGDTSGGYQVLEIQPEKVVFLKGSEKLEVELKKE